MVPRTMIRGALRQAVFLALVSVALLSAAAFGGGGCPPPDDAASTLVDHHREP